MTRYAVGKVPYNIFLIRNMVCQMIKRKKRKKNKLKNGVEKHRYAGRKPVIGYRYRQLNSLFDILKPR